MKIETINDWALYPPLPDNADEQVEAFIATERARWKKHRSFMEIRESDRIQAHGIYTEQIFAVFSSVAYELFSRSMVFDSSDQLPEQLSNINGNLWLDRPALSAGKAYREFPDEGRGGTLHWRWTKTGWSLKWNNVSGWIRTSELSQTSDEIINNMTEEADAGMTPLTGGRTGWP
jgi:hypothetical protein